MASGFPESVPPGRRACRRQLVHQVGAAREGRERQAAAGDLAENRQVGPDAVELLRASAGDPEARDDLVEDEHGAAGIGERSQRLEEARLGRDDAHVPGDGLDDDGRQPLAVALDRRADAFTSLKAQTTVSTAAP